MAEASITSRSFATTPSPTVTDLVLDSLIAHGCTRAFGILGGAAVPLFSELVRRGLDPIHVRHESGAVFVALEHELAGGGPGLVFTTTGPGLTNALTGMAAARQEGGHVVLVSAFTGAERRGRGAFQETNTHTYPNCGLFANGGWFDYAVDLQHPAEAVVVRARLMEGLARPGGFVAHVAIPLGLQTAPAAANAAQGGLSLIANNTPQSMIDAALPELAGKRVAIWVGHGGRHAAAAIRQLVDTLDARVMCSPRAKGIFPESDPRFLGVTGFGGHANVFSGLAGFAPETTLVLGSRLGELTSFWDPRLIAGTRLVHVDVDSSAFSAAYPEAETLGVCSEIGDWVAGVLTRLPAPRITHVPSIVRPAPLEAESDEHVASEPPGTDVRPSRLMAALQRHVVEATDIPIGAEPGNSFLWTTNLLRFDEPHRFRTSMAFGSMGHFTAGVFGTALARRGPAIAVVGDGAMLMGNELSSAVSLGVPAIWIVLNDGCYGLVAAGMQGLGVEPFGLDFHRVDFAEYARALGASGLCVRSEDDLDEALKTTLELAKAGPVVLDVHVDRAELAPFGERNRSLADQSSEPRSA
jgi:acetolactate synthase-1/2/3 large subunit